MKLELIVSDSKVNSNVTFDSNIKKQIDELAKKLNVKQSTIVNSLCHQGLKNLYSENKNETRDSKAHI